MKIKRISKFDAIKKKILSVLEVMSITSLFTIPGFILLGVFVGFTATLFLINYISFLMGMGLLVICDQYKKDFTLSNIKRLLIKYFGAKGYVTVRFENDTMEAEIIEWLKENKTILYYYDTNYFGSQITGKYIFFNEKDLLMFKLVWG